MEKIRAFLCIEITDTGILDEIKQVQDEFKHLRSKIKSTERENLHITLKFLGDISLETSEKIIALLDQVKFTGFDLTFNGIGCFPNIYRPRIVWIGTEAGTEAVKNIYSQIENQLSKFGFKKEKFTSHITISRVKFFDNGDSNKFVKLIESFKNKDFGTMNVSSFQLKKSTLTPKGPIYETLKDFKV